MALIPTGFDARTEEPMADFSAIPAGKYLAAITASENKPTRAGTGSYLELMFQILEGEYKGRNLWARLNLDNPNATAVEIARSELAAICMAVGVPTPQDSAQLHDLPLEIRVAVRKRQDNGELTNEVKGYAPRPSGVSGVGVPVAPAPQGVDATVAPAHQPVGSDTPPPWSR